jgi:hypothetical protein
VVLHFPKSGITADMTNYRGITLLDTLSKLLNKVIANRFLANAKDAGLSCVSGCLRQPGPRPLTTAGLKLCCGNPGHSTSR